MFVTQIFDRIAVLFMLAVKLEGSTLIQSDMRKHLKYPQINIDVF